jgi:signal transduction histidine kinase
MSEDRLINPEKMPPNKEESRFRWPSRTFMVLVPLHLAAFLALYLGTIKIVQNEILRSHSADARLILQEAVRDLHPIMVAHDGMDARERIQKFVEVHKLLDLKLYDSSGVLVGEPSTAAVSQEAARFLSLGDREIFRLAKENDQLSLHGLVRLEAGGPCVECHSPGQLLGVASMHLDMTPHVAAAHDRMGRNMAVLVIAWVIIVGVINMSAGWVTRRSVAALEAKIDSENGGQNSQATEMGSIFFDPMSARLYESLRDVMARQRERETEVSSRLQHTERLASLGELAAGLAHEIKNPLAGIHGVLELLRDESDDESKMSLYGEMLRELDRVNGTIQSLLGFARPAKPRRKATDVEVLLDSTAQLMRPGLVKRGIKLEISTAPNLSEFDIDPVQIRQVLVNLISNAADAIEEKGTIAVNATALPDGKGLLLAVEDDGSGISEDSLAQIFEPFHTTKFSGTGLGLSVVRSFVQQHGGRIEVESEPDKGSTFFVVLPDTVESEDESTPSEV